MTKLRTLVEECNFGLVVVCHLKRIEGKSGHEEGATTSLSHLRGSLCYYYRYGYWLWRETNNLLK